MRTNGAILRWAGLGLAVLLAGCSTPATRIRQKPELFASFPSDVQEKIKQGKVDVGFTRDMVYMALGDPDRRYSRKTAEGEVEVWAYVETVRTTERQRVEGPFRYRAPDGQFRTIRDTMWVDVEQRHELERLRVEFKDGIVTAVEEITR
jgi:outer membrane protein assembly factor BamE (lipoprotein component of BamABCDE complex)